jgi:hypothetical protein
LNAPPRIDVVGAAHASQSRPKSCSKLAPPLRSPALEALPVRKLSTTAKTGALRRTFTMVIKSFTGGPSSNQMEDANTKDAVKSPLVSPRDVQPDRGRVRLLGSFVQNFQAGSECGAGLFFAWCDWRLSRPRAERLPPRHQPS